MSCDVGEVTERLENDFEKTISCAILALVYIYYILSNVIPLKFVHN